MIRPGSFFTPARSATGLVFLAALVLGGLAWVSIAALRVENAQREAAARADQLNKERLALWRLDSQMLPSIGLENNRPFAHYYALHVPAPLVLTATGEVAVDPGRVPSPLLSTDFPPWVSLHVQIDQERGWDSPQVLSQELANRLNSDPLNLSLDNVTLEREALLADLRTRFPTSSLLTRLAEREKQEPDLLPYVVPVPISDEPVSEKPAPGSFLTDAPGWMRPAAPDEIPSTLTTYGQPALGERAALASAMGQLESRNKRVMDQLFLQETIPSSGEENRKSLKDGASAEQKAKPIVLPVPLPAERPMPVAILPQATPFQLPPKYEVVRNPDLLGGGGMGKESATGGSLYGPNSNLELNPDEAARRRLANTVITSRGGNDSKVSQGRSASSPFSQQLQPIPVPYSGTGVGPPGTSPQDPPAMPKQSDRAGNEGGRNGSQQDALRDTVEWAQNLAKNIQNKAQQSMELEQQTRPQTAAPASRIVPKPEILPGAPGPAPKGGAAELKSLEECELRESGRYIALRKTTFSRDGRADPGVQAGELKPPPVVQPVPVHLGPMRPRWILDDQGTEHLFLLRSARLDHKTLYQGVLIDWPLLQESLTLQIADLFPTAMLKPLRSPDDSAPERTMTSLPVYLDPGPPQVLPAPRWSPLRIGLVLAWAAALLAIAAAAVAGRAVLALSERRIRFASAVTHELRSPLTGLQLHLDLLTSGLITDEAKQAEYLATVTAEAERLNRLVENVLDFAKLEKRTAMATAQHVTIEELLESTRATWTTRLATHGFDFIVQEMTPPHTSVRIDPRVIGQVLGNLLDNARKYAAAGVDRRIWLTVKPAPRNRIAVEIEDRGPGIPAAERRSVFRAFRRGTRNSDSGGVGLGLSLAKQWAELFGGSLTYRPAEGGVGACFRLELPVALQEVPSRN